MNLNDKAWQQFALHIKAVPIGTFDGTKEYGDPGPEVRRFAVKCAVRRYHQEVAKDLGFDNIPWQGEI